MVKENAVGELSLKFRRKCLELFAPKLFAEWNLTFGIDTPKQDRPMITFLKNRYDNKPLVGCEIGVREGINAQRILETLNIECLYLVDPYKPYNEPLFKITSSEDYQTQMFAESKQRLERFKGKVRWVRVASDGASCVLPMLDFCYIDGDHSYGQVKRDIQNYLPLIKQGGVIGGHDFNVSYLGVCRAVLESFCGGNVAGSGIDWWVLIK